MSVDKRVRDGLGVVSTLTSAFFATVTPAAINYWQPLTGSEGLSYLMIFAVTALAILLIDLVSKFMVTTSRNVRKVLYGSRFIEGFWFDIARSGSTNEILEVAIITIGFRNEAIWMSAILFDINGTRIGKFNTLMSEFDGITLRYAYDREAMHNKLERGMGYGEYRFTEEIPYPLSFTGTFWDPDMTQSIEVYGERIVSQSDIKLVRSSEPKDMSILARNIYSKFRDEDSPPSKEVKTTSHSLSARGQFRPLM